jgi:hypothetical protein
MAILQTGFIPATSNISISFGNSFNMQGARVVNVLVQNNCSAVLYVTNRCPVSVASFNFQFQRSLDGFNLTVSLLDRISYFSAVITVVINTVQIPVQGGWVEFVRAGGLRIISPGNVAIFNLSSPSILAVDPRRSNLATFSIQDIRGLPATSSASNLTIRISPGRNISNQGSIEVQIPRSLAFDPSGVIQVIPLDSAYLNATSLEARLLVSQSNFSIISIQLARRVGVSPLLIAGTSLSLQLLAFRTPSVQPPLSIGPFRIRTLNIANSSRFSIGWDFPDSWGSLSDAGRVMESSEECCLSVQLTNMGPMSALAALTIRSPFAGAKSNMTFQFVTSIEIPASTFILILMPAGFQACSAAPCSPGACTTSSCSPNCVDQQLQIFSVVSYDSDDISNSSSLPAKIWRCGSNSQDVLGSLCSAALTDCSETSLYAGSNAIAFSTSSAINAGYKVVIEVGGIGLPRTLATMNPFTVTLQQPGSNLISPWTQATIRPVVNLSAFTIPSQNCFITPQDQTVGVITAYSIFLLSSTGLPQDGYLEITFPNGTRFSNLRLLGAAFSGSIALTGTPQSNTLFLQIPASTSRNLYGNAQIHLLPNQCVITVAQAAASDPVPKTIAWSSQYSGWASWFFSSWCFRTTGSVSASVSLTYASTLPPQRIDIQRSDASSSAPIDTSAYSAFAISNLKAGISLSVVNQNTIRISGPNCGQGCFLFPFPPQGIMNLTVGGIMNGPIPKISPGNFSIKLFATDGSLLEQGNSIRATALSPRIVSAEILLDSNRAHDRTNCSVIINIDSQIQAGSSVEVKFADIAIDYGDPRASFSGANNLLSISNLNLSDSVLEITSRSLLLNPATSNRFFPVRASIISFDASRCYWNQSRSGVDPGSALKTCQANAVLTVRILISSSVPANSILGFRLVGSLRNPARPGQYSWPLDAVKVYQWDASVADAHKMLTADALQFYSPAQLTLVTNGLASLQVNITGGTIVQPSTMLSNPVTGENTNIRFSFVSESGILTSDVIFVFVPNTFTASPMSSNQNIALSVIGVTKGLPGTLSVNSITQLRAGLLVGLVHTLGQRDCAAASVSSGFDQPISFMLGPFTTREYATQNFMGQQEPGYGFGIFVVDEFNRVIDSSEFGMTVLPMSWNNFSGSFPSQPLQPKIFNLTAIVTNKRSGAFVNVSLVFVPSDMIVNGSEFFLFLPPGFAITGKAGLVVLNQNVTLNRLMSLGPVQREIVANSQFIQSAVLRVRLNSFIAGGSQLTLTVSNLMNPMGGPSESAPLFTLAVAYGCWAISAARCFWLVGSGTARAPIIQPGAINGGVIKFSSTSAGNQIMSEFSLATTNPFPPHGSVEIRIPLGYRALPGLSYCSDLLRKDNTCSTPCTVLQSGYCPVSLVLNSSSIRINDNGSTIQIKSWNSQDVHSISPEVIYPNFTFSLNRSIYPDNLHMPGLTGVRLAFNLSSLRLRQSPGLPGFFVIRILDSNGNVIDETDGLGLQPSSGPILPNRLLMTMVQPISLAAAEITTVVIQLKSFNPIPSFGRICIALPFGFDISTAVLFPLRNNDYSNSSVQGQEVCVIDVKGKQAGSFLRILLSGVKNPTFVGPTGEFEIKTTDPEYNTIDQDLHVLFQVIHPALLSNALVRPVQPKVGANSDVTISFSSPVTSTAGTVLVSLPSGYDIHTSSDIPIKSIVNNNITLCSNDTVVCSNATSRRIPYPILGLKGFFPVSSYSDQNQVVTIFGSDFDKAPAILAKFGSNRVPATVISPNMVEIEVNCDIRNPQRPSFCNFVDSEASVIRRTCNSSSGKAFCHPSACRNTSMLNSTCFDIAVHLSAALALSLDGSLYAFSNISYSLYLNIEDSCPKNCGYSSRRGICNGNTCTCKYPFVGIDCGVGPIPLSVSPNFGPISGETISLYFFLICLELTQFFPQEVLRSLSRWPHQFRCTLRGSITNVYLVPKL